MKQCLKEGRDASIRYAQIWAGRQANKWTIVPLHICTHTLLHAHIYTHVQAHLVSSTLSINIFKRRKKNMEAISATFPNCSPDGPVG